MNSSEPVPLRWFKHSFVYVNTLSSSLNIFTCNFGGITSIQCFSESDVACTVSAVCGPSRRNGLSALGFIWIAVLSSKEGSHKCWRRPSIPLLLAHTERVGELATLLRVARTAQAGPPIVNALAVAPVLAAPFFSEVDLITFLLR